MGTRTTRAKLYKPATGERLWGAAMSANLDALDGSNALGAFAATPNESPSTSRILAVAAGRYVDSAGSVATYAGGTITVTATSTRAIYLNAAGTLTQAAAFPTSWHLRIATATADASTLTAIVDERIANAPAAGPPLGGLAVAAAESPSASLNVAVSAGRYANASGVATSYAGGTIAITTASTRYVYIDATTGTLTQAAAYPAAGTAIVRLATVVAGASTITSVTDDRVPFGPTGVAALPLSGGTMAEGSTIAAGTTTGLKIGASTSQKIGFFNATPVARPAAYTNTYSTTDRTLGAYTSDPESSAYTGLATGVGGTPYAAVTDVNALRAAYETLRVFAEDLAQQHNAIVADLKSLGLIG